MRTNHTFIVKDVMNYVNKELNKTFPEYFIRNFMKNHMRLTYKKVKPRPNNIDFAKLNCVRTLFSFKISKLLNEDTLIINIDQSSINRHMKTERSWGFKGVELEAKSLNFWNSTSMWMAILSNGAWFCMLTNETITSDKILLFLWKLDWWIRENNHFEYSNILLLLDNCSIQKSKEVKDLLIKLSWKTMYLPVYTPIYAPIENCFSLIKSYLKKNYKTKDVKINLKQNYNIIYYALKSICSRTIKRLFANLIGKIRENLNNLLL